MLMSYENCLTNADECNKRAGNAKRFEMKVQYRELAQQWRYLADQVEKLARPRLDLRIRSAV
jgi:hypothetical protein